jgi:hypothetical protein
LARDIDRAPLVTGNVYSCPADFGIDMGLTFRYHGSRRVSLKVDLTGCAWITSGAPQVSFAGKARSVTTKLRDDLVPLSPPLWAKRWLTGY